MFERIMSFKRGRMRAANQNHPGDDGAVPVEDVRAVATEGALATAVDVSPAVLVTLWTQDQRLHPDGRGPGRRAS